MRIAHYDQTVVGECGTLCGVMAPHHNCSNERHIPLLACICADCSACNRHRKCVISPAAAYKHEVLKLTTRCPWSWDQGVMRGSYLCAN